MLRSLSFLNYKERGLWWDKSWTHVTLYIINKDKGNVEHTSFNETFFTRSFTMPIKVSLAFWDKASAALRSSSRRVGVEESKWQGVVGVGEAPVEERKSVVSQSLLLEYQKCWVPVEEWLGAGCLGAVGEVTVEGWMGVAGEEPVDGWLTSARNPQSFVSC